MRIVSGLFCQDVFSLLLAAVLKIAQHSIFYKRIERFETFGDHDIRHSCKVEGEYDGLIIVEKRLAVHISKSACDKVAFTVERIGNYKKLHESAPFLFILKNSIAQIGFDVNKKSLLSVGGFYLWVSPRGKSVGGVNCADIQNVGGPLDFGAEMS